MVQIIIDADSDDLPLLRDSIETLREKLGDLTPLMDAIGGLLESGTRQRFTDKKAPDGTAWANLMPNSERAKRNTKRKTEKGGGILVFSGNLKQSITHHADPYSVTVGTPELYGVYHQFGTDDMSARPFLGLSDDDKSDIYELINEHLMGD